MGLKSTYVVLFLKILLISATDEGDAIERSASLVVLPPLIIGYEDLYIDNDGPIPPGPPKREMFYDDNYTPQKAQSVTQPSPESAETTKYSTTTRAPTQSTKPKVTTKKAVTVTKTTKRTTKTTKKTIKTTKKTAKSTKKTSKTKKPSKSKITKTKAPKKPKPGGKANTKKKKPNSPKKGGSKKKQKTKGKKTKKNKLLKREGSDDVNDDVNDDDDDDDDSDENTSSNEETEESDQEHVDITQSVEQSHDDEPSDELTRVFPDVPTVLDTLPNEASIVNNEKVIDVYEIISGETEHSPIVHIDGKRNGIVDQSNPDTKDKPELQYVSLLTRKLGNDIRSGLATKKENELREGGELREGDDRSVITLKGQGEIGEGKEVLDFTGNFRVPKKVLDCPCFKELLQQEKPAF